MRKIQIEPRHFRRDNTFIIVGYNNALKRKFIHKKLAFGDLVFEEIALLSKRVNGNRPFDKIELFFTDFPHIVDVFNGCIDESFESHTYFLERYQKRAPHLFLSSVNPEQLQQLQQQTFSER